MRVGRLVSLMVAFGAVSAEAQAPARQGRGALAATMDFGDLADRVRPSLVQILTTSDSVRTAPAGLPSSDQGTGSGVVLDPAGYIVTNAHVVRGARRVQVVLGTPTRPPESRSILKAQGRTMGAQVVGIDVETDLAVL